MIYEVRTYTLKPGTVSEFEDHFAEALPHREKYSPLAAFWHTDIARTYPRSYLHCHQLPGGPGLHSGRCGPQSGPGPLHRLESHLRCRLPDVSADPPYRAGHAGKGGYPGVRRSLPQPRLWSFPAGREPTLLAGTLGKPSGKRIRFKSGSKNNKELA